MTIRQSDIARELDVSDMTVTRAVEALGITSRPLSDFDSFKLIFAAELQNVGLAWHVVAELMAEYAHEVRFVFKYADRRCWLLFVNNDRVSFSTAAMSEGHLASLIDLFPMSLTLPLHSTAARAADRLQAVKNRKAAA